jgi:enoyl-CoA hydratase/carnithine racemase
MAEVTYRVDRGVAWLTIDRPAARNALNQSARDQLWSGVRRFNDDADAKVLVLTGAGDKAFSAGADLQEMADTGFAVPPIDFLPQFGRNIDVEKPTIAAVNGIAVAGGFLLAQTCDLCVACPEARFGITEARVGRGAPWAANLAWLVPPRIALELLLTGELISAERAREIGFVNRIVAREELRATVQSLAETIAANAPLSVRAAKQMVRESNRAWRQNFDEAEALWAPVYLSADAQEGPASFRERRPPRWTGR